MKPAWITNDAGAATRLRTADHAYETTRLVARNMPLAFKLAMLRSAEQQRRDAYALIIQDMQTR